MIAINSTKKAISKTLLSSKPVLSAFVNNTNSCRQFSSTTASLNENEKKKEKFGRLPSFSDIKAIELDKYIKELCEC